MRRTMKELEMSVTGMSSEEWDKRTLEARQALDAIRAEYEAELFARYDAGLLVIGCEPSPKRATIYSHSGVDRELYGVKFSTLSRMADRAFTIDW